MIRRILFAWLLLAVGVVTSAGVAAASSSDESAMVAKINAERTSRGMNPLEVYWDLTDDARAWTARMIADGEISHNPDLAGVTSGWSSLGENVGVGPNVDRLHEAFMDSAGHRANILGGFNYVGVGADRAPDGNMYITVVLMLGPEGLVSPATTTTTAPPTTTTTAPVTTTTTAAPAAIATTTTTAPSTSAPSTTTTTQLLTASAAPTPVFSLDTSTVSADHVSIGYRTVYPCTRAMIMATTSRVYCVV